MAQERTCSISQRGELARVGRGLGRATIFEHCRGINSQIDCCIEPAHDRAGNAVHVHRGTQADNYIKQLTFHALHPRPHARWPRC